MNQQVFQYLHLPLGKDLLHPFAWVKQTKFHWKCKSFLWPNFWKFVISIYIDDVAFKHKCKPFWSAKRRRNMDRRKPIQKLRINQTAKGRKEGKNQAKICVSILHGKGVAKELFFANLLPKLWILNVIVTLLL